MTAGPTAEDTAVGNPQPDTAADPAADRRVSTIINAIPAVVAYWDRDQRNQHVNDAVAEWTARTPDQIRGLHMREVLGDTLYEENLPHISAALEGEPQLYGRTLVDVAGQRRNVQVQYVPDLRDGQVLGFFVLITDITEMVLAERRKRGDAELYRTLARSVPSVFVLLFDSDLRYIIAEGQELGAFGYTSADLEGRTIHEVLPPELAQELDPYYRSALSGREVGWTRKIGPQIFSLTARPVHSEDGISAGIVVAIDITERQQREHTWAALHEIATAVARSAAPLDIAERVASVLKDLFSVDSAAVVRFSEGQQGEIVAMAPVLPPEISRMQSFLPGDSSAAAMVAFTGKPSIVTYQDEGHFGAQILAGGFRSGMGAPIRVDGELWGSIVLASRSAVGLSRTTLDRLSEFAELVAIAIGNTEAWSALEHSASTDPLTGLLNRRAFEAGLSRELKVADVHGSRLSVVVLDIDDFKKVNDSFGHQVGDEVLVEVTRRLGRTARRGELLGRLGGEEFLWLLPGSGGEDAWQAAERARLAIESVPFGRVGTLTVSAGVCELADADANRLINCADQALYRAKQRGRNNSVRYRNPGEAG
jgi:diguanylate cyclase (GGDEF)-like protein/PAS domain S-box-containing protein